MNGRKQVISCKEIFKNSSEHFILISNRFLNTAIKDLQEEIIFRIHNKTYAALGFKNDSRGYEFRNEFFEESSSLKEMVQV